MKNLKKKHPNCNFKGMFHLKCNVNSIDHLWQAVEYHKNDFVPRFVKNEIKQKHL